MTRVLIRRIDKFVVTLIQALTVEVDDVVFLAGSLSFLLAARLADMHMCVTVLRQVFVLRCALSQLRYSWDEV